MRTVFRVPLARLREWTEAGMSAPEIATVTGFRPSTVNVALKAFGLKTIRKYQAPKVSDREFKAAYRVAPVARPRRGDPPACAAWKQSKRFGLEPDRRTRAHGSITNVTSGMALAA